MVCGGHLYPSICTTSLGLLRWPSGLKCSYFALPGSWCCSVQVRIPLVTSILRMKNVCKFDTWGLILTKGYWVPQSESLISLKLQSVVSSWHHLYGSNLHITAIAGQFCWGNSDQGWCLWIILILLQYFQNVTQNLMYNIDRKKCNALPIIYIFCWIRKGLGIF